MCNPSSDWDTKIQPLAQVIFFVQPLAHEHFFHILYYFSGNIDLSFFNYILQTHWSII